MDLIDIAKTITEKGMIASVPIHKWNGLLPQRSEWNSKYIQLLPENFYKAFSLAERNILDNFKLHTIKCSFGNFMPDAVLKKWFHIHNGYSEAFYLAKNLVIDNIDGIKDAARASSVLHFTKYWLQQHPAEKLPPPSGVLYTSNLAASLVPKKEELSLMYEIEPIFYNHPFCFMEQERDNRLAQVCDNGNIRSMAWHTINELIANNYKTFACNIKKSMNRKQAIGCRISIATRSAQHIINTEILHQTGLSVLAKRILDVVGHKPAVDVDKKEFDYILEQALAKAQTLSTVNGIVDILNQKEIND